MSAYLRLNLVLAVLIIASSLWLIRSSNEARGLFVALGRAQAEEKSLSVEHDRLQAERRTAATPLVVEGLVRKRLGMFNVKPDVTRYVADNGHAVGEAGASASAAAREGAR